MSAEESARERQLLLESWQNPQRGLPGFFSDVSHRTIGLRFVVTAFVFFLLGGLEALAMRLQLARPEQTLLDADLYNQVFTTHGSTMMFLFAVPIMGGVGLYVVPLMIGTRNSAFPRLAAFAYYTYLIGGLLLYVSFFLNVGPDAGWFAYPPLSGPDYGAGKRVDVWAQLITFTEISALSTAVNLIVTIFKHRAPGMSLDRMPLFVWAMLVQSFMVVFAMPAVMLGSLMLATDRLIGTQFFNYGEGGDVLLWQHLFWFFGHPEVYIIFVPALGMLSTLLVTFTRRQVFGYSALVLSMVATGFIGFGVWVHHMFATGIPQLSSSFFTAASILITIPTGVQFFCWIATLFGGSIRLTTPMLFALGFFGVFVIGGVTGVMLASVPLDIQLHDTYFVVAHLHYVLIGGAVFPLLGALHYWFPKATGKRLSERLGRWTFATFFVGFNLTFFPLHVLGLRGMPRRVFTYPADRGFNDLNLLASVGAAVLALSVMLLLLNAWRSLRGGAFAGDNPWHADTLEWSAASPPQAYNFEPLPTVSSRYPLWTRRSDEPYVRGLRSDRHEVLVTHLLDAEPDHRTELPGPTLWPLWAAVATGILFVTAIFTPWGVVVGAPLLGAAMIGWYWPRTPFKEELAPEQTTRSPLSHAEAEHRHQPLRERIEAATEVQQQSADPCLEVGHLATEAFGNRAPLWWGVLGMMAIEGSMFVLLFVSYFYLRDRAIDWPPIALPRLSYQLSTSATVLLILSCVPMYISTRGAKTGSLKLMRHGLGWGTLLCAAFWALRYHELSTLPFRWDSNAYGSVFWTMTCMHLMHGLIGSGENLVILAILWRGPVEEKHLVDIAVSGVYWYFIVASGVLVYALEYLDPLALGL
ncbi:MAG: cytochrome c oxidase, subunit [Myxococcaceae bacterium]|nr:cytochrome c oxidase, subunit [Myxococcaceae bacterium]